MNYPDIFFTPEYQELFKDTEFGGEPCHFACAGIDYRFYKRAIEGTPYFDIVSPYGYSGPIALMADAQWIIFLDAFHDYCLEDNIVAEFARLHPFIGTNIWLSPYYERDIYYIGLVDSREQIWHNFDKGCKSAVKKAQREFGFAQFLGGISDEFPCQYQSQSLYHFDYEFFDKARRLLAGYIVTFTAGESLALFLIYGDYCHYFLSAGHGAANLILWEAIQWAKAQGCKLFNLGGGLRAGDSLESFKRSFTPFHKPFFTYRKIHNQKMYNELCEAKGIDPKSKGYFPAYRN